MRVSPFGYVIVSHLLSYCGHLLPLIVMIRIGVRQNTQRTQRHYCTFIFVVNLGANRLKVVLPTTAFGTPALDLIGDGQGMRLRLAWDRGLPRPGVGDVGWTRISAAAVGSLGSQEAYLDCISVTLAIFSRL